MKYIDSFTHEYTGFGNTLSRCIVHVAADEDKFYILFEDIGIGASVTNASELLATQIVKRLQLKPEDCRFFETYRRESSEDSKKPYYNVFDEIEYLWKVKQVFTNKFYEATNPNWKIGPIEIRNAFKLNYLEKEYF